MGMWQCDFTFELSWRELADGGRSCRHAGSWSYIQWSTCDHVSKGKTINPGCMLYMVYAVLGVCSPRCQLMILTWRDREGWLNFIVCDDGRVVQDRERDGGWRWEWCGGYKQIWEIMGTTCLIRFQRPLISVKRRQLGTCTCRIGDG